MIIYIMVIHQYQKKAITETQIIKNPALLYTYYIQKKFYEQEF